MKAKGSEHSNLPYQRDSADSELIQADSAPPPCQAAKLAEIISPAVIKKLRTHVAS